MPLKKLLTPPAVSMLLTSPSLVSTGTWKPSLVLSYSSTLMYPEGRFDGRILRNVRM